MPRCTYEWMYSYLFGLVSNPFGAVVMLARRVHTIIFHFTGYVIFIWIEQQWSHYVHDTNDVFVCFQESINLFRWLKMSFSLFFFFRCWPLIQSLCVSFDCNGAGRECLDDAINWFEKWNTLFWIAVLNASVTVLSFWRYVDLISIEMLKMNAQTWADVEQSCDVQFIAQMQSTAANIRIFEMCSSGFVSANRSEQQQTCLVDFILIGRHEWRRINQIDVISERFIIRDWLQAARYDQMWCLLSMKELWEETFPTASRKSFSTNRNKDILPVVASVITSCRLRARSMLIWTSTIM